MALRHPGHSLLLLAALAAVVVPWYVVGRTLADARPVARSPVAASAVVWGNRVFTSRQPLAAWLHRRGASYAVWAGRHPDAGRALAG